ncbi:hypothetical protein ACQ4PT_016240 [Festuca glaucescens]
MVMLFGGSIRAGGWRLLGCYSMALAAAWMLFHGACAMDDGGSLSDGAGMGNRWTGSSLPAQVHGRTLPRVHGNLGDLPVELFGGALPVDVKEDDSDIIFMDQHRVNMQWLVDVQDVFDAWIDGMDDLLDAQNEFDTMNNGGVHVAVEMEGEEEVGAEMQGEEEVAAETAGVEDDGAEREGKEDVAADMEGVEEDGGNMHGVEEDVAEIEEVQDVVDETRGVRDYDALIAGEQVIFDVMFDIHHPKFYVDDNGVYRYREEYITSLGM